MNPHRNKITDSAMNPVDPRMICPRWAALLVSDRGEGR